MPTGDTTDVAATLTDLERKLVALERELGVVTGGPAPDPAGPRTPPGPARVLETAARVEDLRGELADLTRLRERLETTAHELVAEYGLLVERLRDGGGAERPPDAEPDPEQDDERPFAGRVVVDAGPFGDLATLQFFEQALAGIEGAEDVCVRSLGAPRALFALRLSAAVPLVTLLRKRLALPITAVEAADGRLTVDLAPRPHDR